LNAEAKTVQELRAQIPFLGVHRTDQDEPGGMGKGYSFPFHGVHPHSRRIEEQIHDVIFQQVHLIDVEEVPVGVGQDTRFKSFFAFLQGVLDIEGAHQPVLGDPEGELDDSHPSPFPIQATLCLQPLTAGCAQDFSVRVTVERTALYRFRFWKQLGQGAHRRALGRSLSPMIKRPPTAGSITFRISAVFISSCPTWQ